MGRHAFRTDVDVCGDTVIDAIALAVLFRVVPLACSAGRLAISGGGVLRLAAGATCAGVVPGRATAIALDDDLRATPQALDAHARPASEIPSAAFTYAPAAAADGAAGEVTVTVEVLIPARTPTDSDIYLSTERSGWSPSEIRMDQVDARRYRLRIRLRDGARFAFRVTRGSFATIERDAAGRLPPTHLVTAGAGATVVIPVAAWSDDA